MEIDLSRQQQQQQQQPQQYYYYYNSINHHSYHYPWSEAVPEQQHLPAAEDEGAGVVATTMKNGDDIPPAPYTPVYWPWEQFAPLGTDPLDLMSDTAVDFLDIPPSPAGGDFLQAACAPPAQQRCPTPTPPPQLSAFMPYAGPGARMSTAPEPLASSTQSGNVKARVLEILRRMDADSKGKASMEASMEESGGTGGSSSRCFRHMMRERQRRERLSQSYADLYSLVSGRSKADKNSIVHASAAYLAEMRAKAERLKRRNQELKARAAAAAALAKPAPSTAGAAATKIRLRVGNPCSSVDSVMAALLRLKDMGVRARSIRADVSGQELNAAIDVDTNMATVEVEAAVQGALVEVEKKLRVSGDGMNGYFGSAGGGTVAFSGSGSAATGGPARVPDSYTGGGTASSFLHASTSASAPTHQTAQQLLPGSILRWPSGYSSSGNHVPFRHLS